MALLFDPTLAVVAFGALAWIAIAVIALAGCKVAARADAEMTAQDDAVAMAGPMSWLLSQSPPGEHVADGAQEDLHVPPQRPVGDVQVIHRAHLA